LALFCLTGNIHNAVFLHNPKPYLSGVDLLSTLAIVRLLRSAIINAEVRLAVAGTATVYPTHSRYYDIFTNAY
jgi:hypothetical protein